MAEQALFAGDSRAFEAMVQQMLSAQNEVRDGAEKVFSRVKDQSDLCISNLLRLLRTHQDQSIRSFSAVLLRRVRQHFRISFAAHGLANVRCSYCMCSFWRRKIPHSGQNAVWMSRYTLLKVQTACAFEPAIKMR